jgi:hypothetical protein
MAVAILDTNALFKKPELLAQRLKGIDLVVPKIVATELGFLASKRRKMASLPAILNEAVRKGLVSIDEAPDDFISASVTHVHTLADALVLKYAEYRKHKGDEVILVSDDAKLLLSAAQLGVGTATTSSFPPAKALQAPDTQLQKRVRQLIRHQIFALIISFIAGVIASGGASFLLPIVLRLSSTFHTWGPIIGVLLLGPVIYALRGRFRLFYGITEFFVGVLTAIRVFWPDFDLTRINAERTVQILAGLYVMVRGLENIGKALEGTPLEVFWKRFEGTDST